MKFIYYFILILVITSCTKEVKIDIPGYKEQLVIDGSIETGSQAIVLLSKTSDIYAATNLNAYLNGFVSDATVIISDGITTETLTKIYIDSLPSNLQQIAAGLFGVPIDSLSNFNLSVYVSSTNMKGEPGKSYSLTVKHEGKTYTSTTSIQQPTSLDSLYWKPQGNLLDYGFSWAKLSDPPSANDAYKWEVKYLSDPTFSKTFNPYFNDKFFNGLSFEFAYENPMSFNDPSISPQFQGYFKKGDIIVVKFSKLGQKEYNFFEKKYNQMYSGGNPFATPTNIPTNINGGALGIWVGYSPWYDTLICN